MMTSRTTTGRASGTTAPRSRDGRGRRALARLLLFVYLTGPLPASGTETALGGVTTTAGDGTFTANTDQRTEFTQHSQRAILDWSRDIQQPAWHSLEFRQQQDFVVLNRSPGVRASNFFGTVVCDATCIFANEAGITFHDGSYIDVGRMIAVGGSIASDDFMAGRLHFTGIEGPVLNHGTMQGGSIALLGARVANFGEVSTSDGSFMMLAGDEVVIRDHDSPIVITTKLPAPIVDDDADGFDDTPAVENAGEIRADGGEVRLAAGDMLSFAIRNTGRIEADEIVLEGGDEGLVEVRGQLDASSDEGVGGRVHVLGDFVAIEDGAEIDASGRTGGGQVWIGGGPQGQAPVRNARATFVDEEAVVRADAEAEGDGGEVVVWADHTAEVHGHISAMGGLAGGDGGFAETSGKRYLNVTRAPELRARSGRPGDRGGEWLIDPNNIRIVATAADCGSAPECLDAGLSEENRKNPNFASSALQPSVNDSRISAEIIVDALEEGSNVTVVTDTVGPVEGSQQGNIVVDAEIVVKEAAAQEGTDVRLALSAANDIEVNEDIRVERIAGAEQEPSRVELDIWLLAGDPNRTQGPEVAGEAPSAFKGDLDLNASLGTAGGDVALRGTNIRSAAGTMIDTDGGFVDMGGGNIEASSFLPLGAVGGDVVLRGGIDTSSEVLDGDGEPLAGGRIDVRSIAVDRLVTSDSDRFDVFGGDIVVAADVETGGGGVLLDAEGGDLRLDATIASGGAAVSIGAEEQEFEIGTQDDFVTETRGGTVTLTRDARIETEGGDVGVGTDFFLDLRPVTEIVMRGVIDTRRSDPEEIGGRVNFVSADEFGTGNRTVIGEAGGVARIDTGGGAFLSEGDGSFFLEDATIDTTNPDALAASETFQGGYVAINHVGQIEIRESAGGETAIRGEQLVSIGPGSKILPDSNGGRPAPPVGESDVVFDGAVELESDDFSILAGDDYGGNATTAQVVLGDARFYGVGGSLANPVSPKRFFLAQDADLRADDVVDNLGNGLDGVERYTLTSGDGVLVVDDPATVSRPGLDLTLIAGRDVQLASALPTDPVDRLGRLTIGIRESYVLDQLATNISGAAPEITIAVGTNLSDAPGDLMVAADISADDALTLHSGFGGPGDLSFAPGVTLTSDAITLWAGNGDDDDGDLSRVDVSSLGADAFQGAGGGDAVRFVLRQDATIDDSVIPDASLFKGGVDDVDYTLQSDNSEITIGDTSRLTDTRLSLFAEDGISVTDVDPLQVRTLDLGGLLGFGFSSDLYDKILFTPGQESQSRLVLRAGMRTGKNSSDDNRLSFSGFDASNPIRADEIRLVAGDGVGGDAGETASFIDLTNDQTGVRPAFESLTGAPLTFVFRQDNLINQGDLPTVADSFGNQNPGRYAVVSDDGSITLDDFGVAGGSLPRAQSLLVLAAPVVNLLRGDGQDLDFDSDFDPATGDLTELQIRAGQALLQSTSSADEFPEVLPGTTLRLASFLPVDAADAPPPEPNRPPEAFDFDGVPDDAPGVITLVQDGDVDGDNLIDRSQLGDGSNIEFNGYNIRSQRGGITVTPDEVKGARLDLAVVPTTLTETGQPRTIGLAGGGTAFELTSLSAVTPGAWTVEDPDGTSDLTIDAEDFIVLTAASQNEGDLVLNEGTTRLTLRASSISLRAGNDSGDVSDDAPPTPSVVRAWSDNGGGSGNVVFELDVPDDLEDALTGQFEIAQHGDLVDDESRLGDTGTSVIPEANQFVNLDAPGEDLGVILLTALRGSVEILDLFAADGSKHLPTARLGLGAGLGEAPDGARVYLGQQDGQDLDLAGEFEIVSFLSPEVVLETKGDGLIVAAGPGISFEPASFAEPAIDVTFEQENADFDETQQACLDNGGCLPFRSQIAAEGPNIEYTLETDARILVNDVTSLAVDGTHLTLDATEIEFEIAGPGRFDDLFLQSLVAGRDGAPTSIILRDTVGSEFPPLRIVTALEQEYRGDVTLEGAIAMLGGGVRFTGTVDGSTRDDDTLTVYTDGAAVFEGDVGMAGGGADLEALRVGLVTGGPAAAPAHAQFGDDDPSTGGTTHVKADEISFFALSDPIQETPVQRTPLTASIFKRYGDLAFDAETFRMAMGEKLTVQGDLAIEVGQKAAIGDLSAETIYVGRRRGVAGAPLPTIELVRRPPAEYLTGAGTLALDSGVDYVANSIDFRGEIVLGGWGADPIFGVASPRAIPAWMTPFTVLQAQPRGVPLDAGSFEWGVSPVMRDLHPEGASRDDPSNMFWAPNLVPPPPPTPSIPWLPSDVDVIERLDVRLRPASAREYASRLDAAGIIDDVGTDLPGWGRGPLVVSEARVSGRSAQRAHDLYVEIFGPAGANAAQLRGILQEVVDQYVRSTGARRVMGFELRRYVKNRPSSRFDAYELLEDLDLLFALHRDLGLTPGEYVPIQRRWLRAIQPEGITLAELAEAVRPSRYVRGSDVLDIFGD